MISSGIVRTFSNEDLDRIGIDRLERYLTTTGWKLKDDPNRPAVREFSRPDALERVAFVASPKYRDYYVRFAEAITDLAAYEGRSLVRMYLALALGF